MIDDGTPKVCAKEMFYDLDTLYNMKCIQYKKIQSYDDIAFLITCSDNQKYIVKYYNMSFTSDVVLKKITDVLLILKDYKVPKPILTTTDHYINFIGDIRESVGCKTKCYLVLFEYVEGDLLASTPKKPSFWKKLGRLVAEISEKLSNICETGFQRHFNWDSLIADNVLESNMQHYPTQDLPNLQLEDVIFNMQNAIKKLTNGSSKRQFIHGDINEFNVVVSDDDDIGIIDFNDLVFSYPVIDLAQTLVYMIAAQNCNLMVGKYIFEGYTEVKNLSDEEISMLYDIMVARFAVSCTLGNMKITSGEANEYVTKSAMANKRFLKKFVEIGREEFYNVLLGK